MKELSVKENLIKRKRAREVAFERRVAESLARAGLFSYHVSEKLRQGAPDRYVVGGNWIEFKRMPFAHQRTVDPVRLFSIQQRNLLDKFSEAGDRAWGGILFQAPTRPPYMLLAPWKLLKGHGPWTSEQVVSASVNVDDREAFEQYIHRRFGRQFERFSNEAVYYDNKEASDFQFEDVP